jgi:hypothetical protein
MVSDYVSFPRNGGRRLHGLISQVYLLLRRTSSWKKTLPASLLFIILVQCLFLSSTIAAVTASATLQSSGTISPISLPPGTILPTLYGSDDVCATWTTNNGQYGSYSAWSSAMDSYIATLKASGGNSIDVLIDAGLPSGSNAGFSSSAAWASDQAVPGYTYWQLLIALSSKLHAQGMYLGIQPTYSSTSGFVSLITSSALTSSYSSQYATIVTTIHPDLANIYSEPEDSADNNPVSSSFMASYVSFCVSVANALKSADSNVTLGVMGLPWWDGRSLFPDGNSYFTTAKGIFNVLPAGTMFITHINYGSGAQSAGGYWTEYYDGDLSQAKTDYYAAMQTYYGVQDCNANGIQILFEAAGGYQSNPNILPFLTDTCSFAKANHIGWITSGSISSYVNNVVYPWAFYTGSHPTSKTLNNYGQTMFSLV